VLLALALHICTWVAFPPSAAKVPINQKIIDSLYLQAAVTTFGLIAASVYYAFSLVERARQETETVLRNVLPESVVERLKAAPGATVADGFSEASVMFADLTGFVSLARTLGPERTVALLNKLVTALDTVASDHGVEKIKTIGDAYMVASGVPLRRPDHLKALAGMALDVRIGMAAGPMMAGVIGKQKFSYDVWGDPVNLASRLEGQSAPGRILVCPACKAVLERDFVLEARGTIEIKGVGAQEAWFLVGRRASA
jgi:adenylate cyclase